jgi:hypothetical protein
MSDTNKSRAAFDEMWKQFDIDCEKNWSGACRNLRRAMCQNAGELVPDYSNMKDFIDMIFKIKEQMKSAERPEDQANPIDTLSSWLRGEKELSRIPLEMTRKN